MIKPIISASRRTDIPAFYSEWLINRVRAGYCCYPNPLYPKKIHHVSLRPADIAGFVFWTRWAKPMLPSLACLDERGDTYYFLYTLLNYPRTVEKRTPVVEDAIADFCRLSQRLGKHRVIWRYDPIIIGGELTPQWHVEVFRNLLGRIAPYTDTVIVSVVDPYQKTVKGFKKADLAISFPPSGYVDLFGEIVRLAQDQGIKVQSCAEEALSVPGVERGGCVDGRRIQLLSGQKVTGALHRQRPGCLCVRSVDIGANNTCSFGCCYCYATSNAQKAMEQQRNHNPNWNAITGHHKDLEPEPNDSKDSTPAPSQPGLPL